MPFNKNVEKKIVRKREDEDIYSNLPEYEDYDIKFEKLQKTNERLRAQIEELESKVNSLTENNTSLSKKERALSRNISVLFTTALAEVQFKDKQLVELRKEMDSLLFRRHMRSKHDEGHSSSSQVRSHPVSIQEDETPSSKHTRSHQEPRDHRYGRSKESSSISQKRQPVKTDRVSEHHQRKQDSPSSTSQHSSSKDVALCSEWGRSLLLKTAQVEKNSAEKSTMPLATPEINARVTRNMDECSRSDGLAQACQSEESLLLKAISAKKKTVNDSLNFDIRPLEASSTQQKRDTQVRVDARKEVTPQNVACHDSGVASSSQTTETELTMKNTDNSQQTKNSSMTSSSKPSESKASKVSKTKHHVNKETTATNTTVNVEINDKKATEDTDKTLSVSPRNCGTTSTLTELINPSKYSDRATSAEPSEIIPNTSCSSSTSNQLEVITSISNSPDDDSQENNTIANSQASGAAEITGENKTDENEKNISQIKNALQSIQADNTKNKDTVCDKSVLNDSLVYAATVNEVTNDSATTYVGTSKNIPCDASAKSPGIHLKPTVVASTSKDVAEKNSAETQNIETTLTTEANATSTPKDRTSDLSLESILKNNLMGGSELTPVRNLKRFRIPKTQLQISEITNSGALKNAGIMNESFEKSTESRKYKLKSPVFHEYENISSLASSLEMSSTECVYSAKRKSRVKIISVSREDSSSDPDEPPCDVNEQKQSVDSCSKTLSSSDKQNKVNNSPRDDYKEKKSLDSHDEPTSDSKSKVLIEKKENVSMETSVETLSNSNKQKQSEDTPRGDPKQEQEPTGDGKEDVDSLNKPVSQCIGNKRKYNEVKQDDNKQKLSVDSSSESSSSANKRKRLEYIRKPIKKIVCLETKDVSNLDSEFYKVFPQLKPTSNSDKIPKKPTSDPPEMLKKPTNNSNEISNKPSSDPLESSKKSTSNSPGLPKVSQTICKSKPVNTQLVDLRHRNIVPTSAQLFYPDEILNWGNDNLKDVSVKKNNDLLRDYGSVNNHGQRDCSDEGRNKSPEPRGSDYRVRRDCTLSSKHTSRRRDNSSRSISRSPSNERRYHGHRSCESQKVLSRHHLHRHRRSSSGERYGSRDRRNMRRSDSSEQDEHNGWNVRLKMTSSKSSSTGRIHRRRGSSPYYEDLHRKRRYSISEEEDVVESNHRSKKSATKSEITKPSTFNNDKKLGGNKGPSSKRKLLAAITEHQVENLTKSNVEKQKQITETTEQNSCLIVKTSDSSCRDSASKATNGTDKFVDATVDMTITRRKRKFVHLESSVQVTTCVQQDEDSQPRSQFRGSETEEGELSSSD